MVLKIKKSFDRFTGSFDKRISFATPDRESIHSGHRNWAMTETFPNHLYDIPPPSAKLDDAEIARRLAKFQSRRCQYSLESETTELLDPDASKTGVPRQHDQIQDDNRNTELKQELKQELTQESKSPNLVWDGRLVDPGYEKVAFHCLSQCTPPRSWTLRLIKNPWFDRLTMMIIIINCITLAIQTPCPVDCDFGCRFLTSVDDIIFAYFAIEMVTSYLYTSAKRVSPQ